MKTVLFVFVLAAATTAPAVASKPHHGHRGYHRHHGGGWGWGWGGGYWGGSYRYGYAYPWCYRAAYRDGTRSSGDFPRQSSFLGVAGYGLAYAEARPNHEPRSRGTYIARRARTHPTTNPDLMRAVALAEKGDHRAARRAMDRALRRGADSVAGVNVGAVDRRRLEKALGIYRSGGRHDDAVMAASIALALGRANEARQAVRKAILERGVDASLLALDRLPMTSDGNFLVDRRAPR